MSNILLAVTQQQLDEFKRILENGWYPKKIVQYSSPATPDFSIWTEVVLRDWIEGFELLHARFPEVSVKEEIWEIALKNASIKCIKFLWNLHEFSPESVPYEFKRAWALALMGGMGEPWSPPHEVRNIKPVYEFLVSQGFDVSMAMEGEFDPGDFRLQGHSLFTRAVFLQNWELARAFWPSSSRQWQKWPRLNEVMVHLLHVITGDYKILSTETRSSPTPEEIVFLRWIDEFGLDWLRTTCVVAAPVDHAVFNNQEDNNQEDSGQEINTMKNMADYSAMTSFGDEDEEDGEDLENKDLENKDKKAEELLEIHTSVRTPETQMNVSLNRPPVSLFRMLSRPNHEKISPWFRLLTMLQQEDRKKIWGLWEKILSDDPELSWLHEIAMYPEDLDVKKIILLARHDHANAFHRFWARQSASGFSPHERWVSMGGDQSLVQAWLPVTPKKQE